MRSIGIDGAWVREPKVFRDPRGSFHEWFQEQENRAATGRDFVLRQANCVVSNRGAVRGLHYTSVPPGQRKYFTCVRGAMLGAVVDVRVGSPTFGDWRTVELTADEPGEFYVCEGLAAGFMALHDDSVLVYLCSQTYQPQFEHGIHPLDPDLGIEWAAGIVPDLSDKDAKAPTLAEARLRGLLPSYEDCA